MELLAPKDFVRTEECVALQLTFASVLMDGLEILAILTSEISNAKTPIVIAITMDNVTGLLELVFVLKDTMLLIALLPSEEFPLTCNIELN